MKKPVRMMQVEGTSYQSVAVDADGRFVPLVDLLDEVNAQRAEGGTTVFKCKDCGAKVIINKPAHLPFGGGLGAGGGVSYSSYAGGGGLGGTREGPLEFMPSAAEGKDKLG